MRCIAPRLSGIEMCSCMCRVKHLVFPLFLLFACFHFRAWSAAGCNRALACSGIARGPAGWRSPREQTAIEMRQAWERCAAPLWAEWRTGPGPEQNLCRVERWWRWRLKRKVCPCGHPSSLKYECLAAVRKKALMIVSFWVSKTQIMFFLWFWISSFLANVLQLFPAQQNTNSRNWPVLSRTVTNGCATKHRLDSSHFLD